ncbi:GTP-binding protein ypt4 [Escovopsis weberi]|uniref:GTP-binding protein ypt4 n=1 Tax=Escovopsis weberi TaxID=150374 RepID=A0A0M9VSP2_ESCWE|nr:GTP-binding protein ypt4 [Escovopsis weberi]
MDGHVNPHTDPNRSLRLSLARSHDTSSRPDRSFPASASAFTIATATACDSDSNNPVDNREDDDDDDTDDDTDDDQTNQTELGSMYDYLAKIILLGPSGSGKSCLLHRFVKNEWRVLSSQTIGVEFATKIIKVGSGSRRKRIKLQLWDTAGTERFRSVSRSYYRGAAGAILVYDISSHVSFQGLQPFLNDARALASPNLSVMLVGNKLDLASESLIDTSVPPSTASSAGPVATMTPVTGPSSFASSNFSHMASSPSMRDYSGSLGGGSQQKATIAPEGREISAADASRWASTVGIPVVTEASAFNGEGVDEIFNRLARMILTKIELGEIDPDDPSSGIQYGDGGGWNTASDGGSIKSSMTGGTMDDGLGNSEARR